MLVCCANSMRHFNSCSATSHLSMNPFTPCVVCDQTISKSSSRCRQIDPCACNHLTFFKFPPCFIFAPSHRVSPPSPMSQPLPVGFRDHYPSVFLHTLLRATWISKYFCLITINVCSIACCVLNCVIHDHLSNYSYTRYEMYRTKPRAITSNRSSLLMMENYMHNWSEFVGYWRSSRSLLNAQSRKTDESQIRLQFLWFEIKNRQSKKDFCQSDNVLHEHSMIPWTWVLAAWCHPWEWSTSDYWCEASGMEADGLNIGDQWSSSNISEESKTADDLRH